mmetsp:Transcript_11856/g.17785  ORF Transcript_11856/g.17785 Transcript_11856/m.17785 type:complete len:396 (+) Transcript_11856:46-1233(+)
MGNSLEGISDKPEPPVGGAPITEKDTERGYMCKLNDDKYAAGMEPSDIRFAVSSMQGWRATMEDTHILAPELKIPIQGKPSSHEVLTDHALFCVFDGHGGSFTSDYAGKHFLRYLTSRSEWKTYIALSTSDRKEVPGLKLVKAALSGAFFDIDIELKSLYKKRIEMYGGTHPSSTNRGRSRRQKKVQTVTDEREPQSSQRQSSPQPPMPKIMVDRSGSTAVMVLLTPHHIICCNAGDSRAIVCKGGNALPLSFDHKPSNPTELNRVKEAGGFVRYRRVDGDLAVSRGLGDFRFKSNEEVDSKNQKVSIDPELVVCPRDSKKDQFLVLACDGIWDVMENQDCAEVVQSFMDEGQNDLGQLCEDMLDTCLRRNSKDNMTICVVSLPACSMAFESIEL